MQEAIEEVRTTSRERNLETVYYIYVVAYDKLIGVLSLRDLILGDLDDPISAIMTENLVHVPPDLDQEEVARSIAKYDLAALPVVNSQGQMLGVVTVDDLVDVVIEEATEDAQKMAAVLPIEHSYFQTEFLSFMRSRVTWLVVLFIGELLTTSVMGHYEAQLTALIDLVIFIPLIISSGGNSGSQSSALVIRALALGEMQPSDWSRVFIRELGMGLTLDTVLGAVGLARVMLGSDVADPLTMGFTVLFSVICVVTLGTMAGSLMPLAIQRVGLDPAVSSTPFVASLVDVFGLIVYFSIARLMLSVAF